MTCLRSMNSIRACASEAFLLGVTAEGCAGVDTTRTWVRRAIADQVSGFALYLTPAALHDSWFVPKVELRAMDERRSQANSFFSGAIFRGYEVETGKREVFDATGIEIGSTLGTVVEENDLETGWRQASNDILRSYLLSE